MTMKNRTLKPRYVILTHIKDGDIDYGINYVEDIYDKPINFNSIKEARKKMNYECKELLDACGVDNKVCKKEQNSIYAEIPVINMENNQPYYILAKWQIVKL